MADLVVRGPRGATTISTRALAVLAEAAALDVTDCTRSTSGLVALTARRLPRADVDGTGSTVVAHVDVALAWPTPVAETAAAVRAAVASRLERHAAVPVAAVDVHVADYVPRDRGSAAGGAPSFPPPADPCAAPVAPPRRPLARVAAPTPSAARRAAVPAPPAISHPAAPARPAVAHPAPPTPVRPVAPARPRAVSPDRPASPTRRPRG